MGTWRKMSKADHNSNMQQLKHAENHRESQKHHPKTRDPQMGTWRKMRKADHNSKKNTQKTTVNHRNTTQKHEFPRWERGEK